MLTKINRTFLCLFLGVAGTTAVFGQTVSSTIVGTLTDPANALVPKAQIMLKQKATGETRTAQSNDAGLFRFLELKAGDYSLQVKAAGFKTFDMSGISLASAETRDLGSLVLQLGSLTEEVSVTAQATPVQTASSERSALVDSTQLGDIALKGRDLFGYMHLIPGVVDSTASRDLSSAFAVQGVGFNGQASGKK